MDKINVWRIVADHFATLKNSNSKNISLVDILVFFGTPAVLLYLIVEAKVCFTPGALNFAATTFAIFIGLLLNIQVLIFTSASKDNSADRKRLLGEVFSNISFSILLFISGLSICATLLFVPAGLTFAILQSIMIYLALTAGLTLLMILKRIHVILQTEIK